EDQDAATTATDRRPAARARQDQTREDEGAGDASTRPSTLQAPGRDLSSRASSQSVRRKKHVRTQSYGRRFTRRGRSLRPEVLGSCQARDGSEQRPLLRQRQLQDEDRPRASTGWVLTPDAATHRPRSL